MMRKLMATMALMPMMMAITAFAADPVVSGVSAKQRYPWNGFVDITCKVSGIDGTTNGLKFSVAAVIPDSGEVRKISQFWVVQNGTNSTDRKVHTNGDYRLVWDAQADLGAVVYSNMVMRVTVVDHDKVQLWEGGPYWAETNIGAKNPEDYGYYFWWGDTVGYKRVSDAWVASDGSSSSFSFDRSNTLTDNKGISTLQNEGWITAGEVLVPEHDAAHVQWGGSWRMPTDQEQSDLNRKCSWEWTTMNGVNGYLVSGKGAYASASIFLPCAGHGFGASLNDAGSDGRCWASVPDSGNASSCGLHFHSSSHVKLHATRYFGYSVRPVQGFAEPVTGVGQAGESVPFLLDTLTTSTSPVVDSLSISWDAAWIGGNSNATVVIVDNGTEIKRTTGSGQFTYSLFGTVQHELIYTTYIGGVAQGEVYTTTAYAKYVVAFDANGGTGTMAAQTFQAGGAQPLTTNAFTYTGHTFAGWATNASGNVVYADGASIMPTGNLTLYAIWNEVYSNSIVSFVIDDGVLTAVDLNGETEVVIPNGVTSIGNRAFYGCSGLMSVTIPNSVISIGSSAFKGCSGLTNVTIPVGVTSIGYSSFEGCSGLRDVVVPQCVCTRGMSSVFPEAYQMITNVVISDAVTSIGYRAFYGCSGLMSVTIPNSVTSIGYGAFYGCSGLTSVSIGNGVKNIHGSAFWGCRGLTSVTIPDSVTNIWSDAFYNCSNLKSVTIPGSVINIGNRAFYGCAGMENLSVLDGVESIGLEAFKGCKGLSDVAIPSSVTNLEFGVFSECSSLTSVAISANIDKIEGSLFLDCTSVTNIIIAGEIKSIGENAFTHCRSLKHIELPGSLKEIRSTAFAGCALLDDISIPNGVLHIGESAFSSCTALREINIPNGVVYVGNGAFWNCKSAKSLRLSDSVVYIGDQAFHGCGNITNVILPDSIRVIGNEVFRNCGSLERVHIGRGALSIGDYAFEGCDKLSDVKLGESVRKIGAGSFYGCSSLCRIDIPESVVRIGVNAFEYCNESLFDKNTIPGFSLVDGWLVDLDYDYFEDYESHLSLNGCRGIADTLRPLFDNVESIDIPETVKGIGSGGLFSGPFWFSDLHQISIPGSVEYVGVNALSTSSQELFTTNMETGAIMIDGWIVGLAYSKMKTDFDASTAKGIAELDIFSGTFSQYGQIGELLSFRFPTNTTYIQNGMFQGCTELGRDSGTIVIPESVVHIGNQAFDGCSSLKNIVIPKGVVYIGEDAFGHCDGLTNLFISSSVAYIGSFTGCDHLEKVTAPLGLKPLIEALEIFDESIVTYYEGDSERITPVFTVRFDAGGGYVGESLRNVEKGKVIGLLPTPTREKHKFLGWYTAAEGGTKVTTSTKVTGDVTYYAHWEYDGSALVTVVVADGCEGMGTVTGGDKMVKAGTKVSLKATASKGHVFVGWRDGDGAVASQLASWSYVATGEPATIEALFATVEDDVASLKVAVEDVEAEADGTVALDLGACVESLTPAKLAVSGLPSGVKYDSKTGMIVGKATKPGVYEVKVSATNASATGKNAVVETFTIAVPNLTTPMFEAAGLDTEGKYVLMAGVVPDGAAVAGQPPYRGINEVISSVVEEGWKLAVSGLPSGVKFDAKRSVLSGVATKEGFYTVYFTATRGSGKTAEKQIATATFEVAFPTLAVEVVDVDWAVATQMGKVTGMGKYPFGKKVALKATANKGHVFVGWYDDWWRLLSKEATYSYVTTDEDVFLTAMFATAAEDSDSLAVYVWDDVTAADGTYSLDLGACVESLSLPKLTVTGLPTGLKYDAKKMTIAGKATKPGVYTVTVKATNTSVKKATAATTGTFTITVPNLSCAALPNLMPETDAYGTVMAGVAFGADRIDCTPAGGWSVKVAGLPSGLKYDAKTGKITGVPTAKAGSYTVTFTASRRGEANQVATITLNVKALPDWVVGTFYGKNVARGLCGTWTCPMQFTVTVSANGKISMKFTGPGEGTASRTAQLTKCREDGSFSFSFHYVSGRKGKEGYDEGDCEGVISPVVYGEDGALLGCLTTHDIGICDEDDDPCESKGVVYQSLYSRKPAVSGLPVFGKDNIKVVTVKSDYSNGEVTLKFGAKGAVTATWSGTTPTATCSSYITPYARDADGTVHAKLWLTFLDKTHFGYHGHPLQVGFDFDLAIPTASASAASEIVVKSVHVVSWLADFYHGGPLEIQVATLPDWAVGSFYGWEQWIEDGDDPSNLGMDVQGFTVHCSGWLSELHGIEQSGNKWNVTYPLNYLPKVLDDDRYEWGLPSAENPPGEHACLQKSLVVSKFLYAGVEIGKATLNAAFKATRTEPKATQYAEFIQDPWAFSVRPQHLPSFDAKDNTLVLKVESYYGPLTARLAFGEKGNVSVSWSGTGISSATTDTRLMPYAYDGDADVCHVTLPVYGGKAVKYGFSAILDLTIPHPDSATAHDVSFSLKASSWQIYGFSIADE